MTSTLTTTPFTSVIENVARISNIKMKITPCAEKGCTKKNDGIVCDHIKIVEEKGALAISSTMILAPMKSTQGGPTNSNCFYIQPNFQVNGASIGPNIKCEANVSTYYTLPYGKAQGPGVEKTLTLKIDLLKATPLLYYLIKDIYKGKELEKIGYKYSTFGIPGDGTFREDTLSFYCKHLKCAQIHFTDTQVRHHVPTYFDPRTEINKLENKPCTIILKPYLFFKSSADAGKIIFTLVLIETIKTDMIDVLDFDGSQMQIVTNAPVDDDVVGGFNQDSPAPASLEKSTRSGVLPDTDDEEEDDMVELPPSPPPTRRVKPKSKPKVVEVYSDEEEEIVSDVDEELSPPPQRRSPPKKLSKSRDTTPVDPPSPVLSVKKKTAKPSSFKPLEVSDEDEDLSPIEPTTIKKKSTRQVEPPTTSSVKKSVKKVKKVDG